MSSQSSSSPSSRPSNDTASEAWGSPEKPVVIDEPEEKPSVCGMRDSGSYNPSSGSERPIGAACDHSNSPTKTVALQPADDASLGTPEKPIVFDDSEQDDYVISAPPSAPKSLTETSTPNTSPLKRAYGPFSVEEDCFDNSEPDSEEERLELVSASHRYSRLEDARRKRRRPACSMTETTKTTFIETVTTRRIAPKSNPPPPSQVLLSSRSTPAAARSTVRRAASPSVTPIAEGATGEVLRKARPSSSSQTDILSQQLYSPPHTTAATPSKVKEARLDNGTKVRIGDSVELHNGHFLRVIRISRETPSSNLKLTGNLMIRMKNFKRLLPSRFNELCWVVDEDEDEDNEGNITLWPRENSVTISEVRRKRRVIFTNHAYVKQMCPRDEDKEQATRRMYEEGLLYCRVKLHREVKSTKQINPYKFYFLEKADCDKGYAITNEELRRKWLGEQRSKRKNSSRKTDYTFGDAFCGAGGVSRGARQAGLRVKWGFDYDENAINSWRVNFTDARGGARGIHSPVWDFIEKTPKTIAQVDILHASPPCQTFSPAHTIAASSDEANEVCILSIPALIKNCRPRMVTLEETSGLTHESHKQFLENVLNGFIELGFSAMWKVVNCKNYGVPQTRKRLVVMASAPGEDLPAFPLPTHGDAHGLQTLPTVLGCIQNIPSDNLNHDPQYFAANARLRPYNGNGLAPTLTCSGSVPHPSGQRNLTNRELACLQTFPVEHYFGYTYVRKQIGNAVPPLLAKAILEQVRQTLEEVDYRQASGWMSSFAA